LERIRVSAYIFRVEIYAGYFTNHLWSITGQEDINLEISKRKFRWFGHTLRKDGGEIPKAALLWNPQLSRRTVRPKTSWRRSVIKEAGRSWNELWFLAADRRKWKRAHRQPMILKDNGIYYYFTNPSSSVLLSAVSTVKHTDGHDLSFDTASLCSFAQIKWHIKPKDKVKGRKMWVR
jgi:hypothetical protein